MITQDEYEKIEQRYLYDVSFNGSYVGLALEKNVFKKIMKLNAKYTAELKEILKDNINDVHLQDWTLNSEDNRKINGQHSVKYVPNEYYTTKEKHIEWFKIDNPKRDRYFMNVDRDLVIKLLDYELDITNAKEG